MDETKDDEEVIELVNLERGLGDVLSCLWTVAAMTAAGSRVRFFTPKDDLARLWHADSRPVWEAGDEATVIFGRLNEARRAGAGENRMQMIRQRVPAAVRPTQVRRPDLLPELEPFAVRPVWSPAWGELPGGDWGRVVLLFPFSEWAHREWPLGHWQLMAARLDEAGLLPVALGLPENRPGLATFRRHAWGLPLLNVIGAMRAAGLTVANDSGPAHLAAALARPMIRIHAMFPPESLDTPGGSRPSAYPPTPGCQGCSSQPSRGYLPTVCATQCAALATISPSDVAARAIRHLNDL